MKKNDVLKFSLLLLITALGMVGCGKVPRLWRILSQKT
jgi:hypothetical protein